MEIRQLTSDEVTSFRSSLTEFLFMVLTENLSQSVTEDDAIKYYNDLLKFTQDGSAVLLGAFDKNELVGFHWSYEVSIFNERRMHSYLNAIDHEYRGQRIGSLFFRKLEEITKERGINIIEAMVTYSNQIAVNYHLKNGFEIERIKVSKHI